MNCCRTETALNKVIRCLLRCALCAAEDDCWSTAICLQDACKHFDLIHRMCTDNMLFDARDDSTFIFIILSTDMYGLIHEATCKSDDVSGHCCREEHCLLTCWSAGKNLFYIGQEAKVEHFISLIENNARDEFQCELSLAIEIEETTWSSDNNFYTVIERLDLWLECATTVNGERADSTIK